MKDNIYSKPHFPLSSFAFNEEVATVFNDMLNRSVPGYEFVVKMIGYIAKQYAKEGTNCYDLGCSLGAVTMSFAHCLKGVDCSIVAVDNSHPMIEKCKINVEKLNSPLPISFICDDVMNVTFENASVVVANLVLQFIEPHKRNDLVKRIYESLAPGGIFVLVEKIAFDERKEQNFQTDMYHMFKKLNGYSDLEISQKRTALENVLIPETVEQYYKRLKTAGFLCIYTWFKIFNFVAIVGVKEGA